MSKTVQFKFPATKSATPDTDRWVEERSQLAEHAGATPQRPAMKRFTIDVSKELHSRIKVDCARRGINMADELRRILEREFPA